jgi:hypothetical protein
MWQNLIVVIAVSAAVCYVVWSLAPQSFRRRIATRWGGHVDRGSCADCAARNNPRSSR